MGLTVVACWIWICWLVGYRGHRDGSGGRRDVEWCWVR